MPASWLGGDTADLKRAAFTAFAIVLLAMPALAAERVDLELVLATDTSRSIDESEARLQREGVAAALRHPDII